MPAPIPPLSDVPALIEQSRTRPPARRLRRLVLTVLAVAVLLSVFDADSQPALAVLAVLAAGGLGYGMVVPAVVRLRREGEAVDTLEGLVALRRWSEASAALHALLSRPMRAEEHRLRALLLLGTTLARTGRTDDAIALYDTLLDDERLGGSGAVLAKLARGMAMLSAERLYDADRAIADLRRMIDRDEPTPAVRPLLAGLRLLELYRDVKTNHLDDALVGFEAHLPLLRSGLGHRVAEAHALAAIALHRLNRPADAAHRFADATVLAPLSDLVRRYPELWPLTQAYAATPTPR